MRDSSDCVEDFRLTPNGQVAFPRLSHLMAYSFIPTESGDDFSTKRGSTRKVRFQTQNTTESGLNDLDLGNQITKIATAASDSRGSVVSCALREVVQLFSWLSSAGLLWQYLTQARGAVRSSQFHRALHCACASGMAHLCAP